MSRRMPWLLLLALPACKHDDPPPPIYLEGLKTSDAGVFVGQGIGTATEVRVPVFATNNYGAMVPAATIAVTSDGTLQTASITPDSSGYGEAILQPGHLGGFTVSAVAGSATADGAGFAIDATPGTIEFPTVAGSGATLMANAGNGLAWAVGGEVWWALPGGAPPIRILSLTTPVLSMVPAQVDADGVTDLLLRSETEVILLKGRDEGGLSWGTGFGGGTMTASSLQDLDGDNIVDLLLGVQDADNVTHVVWATGDGLWNFEQETFLDVTYGILGATGEDYNGDGLAELTLLTEDGLLRRYDRYEGAWVSATTADYELGLGSGAQMLPSADINGDRIPDILAYGPMSDGSGSQAWIVTAGAASPTRYRLFDPANLPAWLGMTVGDLTGEGIFDVAMATPSQLLRVVWGSPQANPTIFVTTDAPTGPALAIGRWAGDDYPDIALASDRIVILPGAVTIDDPSTTDLDETVPWRVQTPAGQLWKLDVDGAPWIGDFSGDGLADIAMIASVDSAIGVRTFVGNTNDGGGLVAGPLVTLAPTGKAMGVAVCNGQLHALLDPGTPTLYRYDIDEAGLLSEALAPIEMPGATLIACGNFLAGDVVVAGPTGSLTYVDADGFVNQGEPSSDVTAIAVQDTDGDGIDTVAQCKDEACQMLSADVDGDGLSDLVTLAGGTLTVEVSSGASYSQLESATGLWLGDVDGDGLADIVTGGAGFWRSYRATNSALVPEDGHYIWWPISDRVSFGDLSGDGIPDLIVAAAADTDPADAVDWTGTMIYSPATAR